jgi:integrase
LKNIDQTPLARFDSPLVVRIRDKAGERGRRFGNYVRQLREGTTSGFRASWRTYRRKLEAAKLVGPGLTQYGLRHTVAVILRECGFFERTIADALGQKTIEMARHYAKGADLKPKMRGGEDTESQTEQAANKNV